MIESNPQQNQVQVTTDVVVIGAGPAGLAVGACLHRAGIPFLILERDNCIGSAWHSHYDRLHLHTARRTSALPYLPFPADYPTYPSRLQVIAYLEDYALHFQIEPRYHQAVTAVRASNGMWQTHTADSLYLSRCVVVATGINQEPVIPTWPGQDTFKGSIIHSSQYTNGEIYRGKAALVVGFGNSGAEIAIDLWEHGAQVSMSVRSPVNVVFRDTLGIPVQRLTILMSRLPGPVVDRLTAPMLRLRFGDLSKYGLTRPPCGAATQVRTYAKIPVIDVGTIKLIKRGLITVYGGIERFGETGVIFADGTQHSFDALILATGYRPGTERFLENTSLPARDSLSSAPGLYFCGFHNSITGLLREISLEAPRIADAIVQNRISP